ncbi:HigA family addiction module antitoxin [uncultured Algimonas sp.]|uniref:HigA family addiction module antitoxin n=1 Tax=uncultured Algimonas sp. TaxID=1547920 RepID=UPI0026073878|nr:HigA family addiction module antitoxin [uncultured Algimonas sp.]
MQRHASIKPTHPGAILRNTVIPALGVTRQAFADALGTTRSTVQRLLAEEIGVSAEMAVRLGKVCGNGPRLWINLQAAYDLHKAEQSVPVDDLPTLEPVSA